MARTFTKLFFLLFSLFVSIVVFPQNRPIGINLAGIQDWSSEFVFVDVFKQSREWIPHESGSDASWSSGVEIPLLENGYPEEIPFNDGINPPQYIRTLMFFGEDLRGIYPSGNYRLIVSGKGKISLWGGADGTFQCPVDTFVAVNNQNGIALEIELSEKSDPVRDIHLIMPGHEYDFETNPFHPQLLEFLEDFQVIRFMDWMKTNDSPVISWEDRNTKDYYTQTLKNGVAYEYIIGICNLMEIDPWICIPHQAHDDYIFKMAKLFSDSLNQDLTLYIEYSNELWNGMFDQNQYAAQKGLDLGFSGEAWNRTWKFTAKRSADIFRIFENEFSDNASLVKIIPGWSGNSWTTNKIIEHFKDPLYNPDLVTADAVAIAPYFGYSVANDLADAGLLSDISLDVLIDSLEVSMESAFGNMLDCKEVADNHSLDLIAYEGGQHLVANGEHQNNEKYTYILTQANRHPEMKDLYCNYFNHWYDSINGGMFCYFSSHGIESKYGSWGVKETYNDINSPKYKGLQNCVFSYNMENSGIIPDDRRIDWNPGIPGGIPLIDSPVKNIVDFGADPEGIADSRSAFLSVINALPSSGGVVYIPEGKFRISSKISLGKSNIVFRGEGRNSQLLMDFGDNCFEVINYDRGNWQNLNTDIQKGSYSLIVPDGSKFIVGKYAEIQQDNSPDVMYTQSEWNQSWAESSVGQLFRITKVNGNEIFFEAAVNIDFSDDWNVKIRPQGFIENVGFEDFYIEKLKEGGSTFFFKNAALCWVKNVESYHTRNSHIGTSTCYALEVRDSYFHHSFSYGGGGSGYGVECGYHVTNCLVENNIFDHLRHAMMVHIGANGNVFGYNYSMNPVQGDGEENLNQGWIPPDISVHGHYPFMNLFEGNDLEEIGIGDYWGPSGRGNTYFRNKVNGDGIIYYDESHYQNIVGNVTTELRDNDNKSHFKIEHGNKVDGIVRWNPEIPDQILPVSYYLDSVPDFFDESNWPPFGPEVELYNELPAKLRIENMLVGSTKNPVKHSEYIIYPNPCNGILNIQHPGNVKSIKLVNITGRELKVKYQEKVYGTSVDFTPMKNGIYFFKIVDNKDVVQTFKVLLQK